MSSFPHWMAAVAQAQPVDRFPDDSGLPCDPGVVSRGIGAVMGHGAWYHGEGP